MRKIQIETARRKRVWKLVRAAGHEAVLAVRQHVRSHGVNHNEWFDGAFTASPAKTSVFYQSGGSCSEVKSFTVHYDGRVSQLGFVGEDAYQNYPNLTEKDPPAFRRRP